MYALPSALPYHPRAGAAVWCGCSLRSGDKNIDDEKSGFLTLSLDLVANTIYTEETKEYS